MTWGVIPVAFRTPKAGDTVVPKRDLGSGVKPGSIKGTVIDVRMNGTCSVRWSNGAKTDNVKFDNIEIA